MNGERKSNAFHIIKFVGIVLLAFVSINRSGGILCAMLLMIPAELVMKHVNTSAEFDDYERVKTKLNPLYEKGCYRKQIPKKKMFIQWSELKLIYMFQIYAIAQSAIFLLSGIITDITGKWYTAQWLMLLTAFLPIPIREGIQSYYERILKKELKKRKKPIIWKPFDRTKDYYYEPVVPIAIEMPYKSFGEIHMKLRNICIQQKYQLWRKDSYDRVGEVYLYMKGEDSIFKIFMVIDTQKKETVTYDNILEPESGELLELLESGGTREDIDRILKGFFEEYFGTLKPEEDIYLTVLICTETMSGYWYMVDTAITQTPGRYWLPAVLSFDTGVLYIAKQKKKYGLNQVEKIKEELLDILSTNNERPHIVQNEFQ